MKPTALRLAATTTLASAALLAACTPPATAGDEVASVNGTPISPEMLDVYANGRLRRPASEISDDERSQLISDLQDLVLLSDAAKTAGVDREPAVAAQLALQRRSVMAQALIEDYLEENPASEEDIQAAYEELSGQANGQQYKARHILVETKDEADAIIAELAADDADFAELAREHSTGPSGPQGGDLGWFSADTMVPPFAEAVVAMENGTYTQEPVQTQFGWHVILREDSRAAEPPPLDQVRDQLAASVEQKKFRDYLETLREDAELEPSL